MAIIPVSLFQNLSSSPNIIRVIKPRRPKWAGHVARMENMENLYKLSVGKPEAKRLHRRPKCRWEDNIKMDLK
jgi:hypothetical protein